MLNTTMIKIFWDVTMLGTQLLALQRQYNPSKWNELLTQQQSVSSQQMSMFSNTVAGTSNLT
jgi:hypothetical protein